MAKIKLTKNELKRQKDELKRYYHYLPTLQLKKQQLQIELSKISQGLEDVQLRQKMFAESLNDWVDVFAEDAFIEGLVQVKQIKITTANIAGLDVPHLEAIEFTFKDYDFFVNPLWVDYGVDAVKQVLTYKINIQVLQKQLLAVRQELSITTQRVNLFEKVKIPQAEEAIRKIRIILGDLQTASVVRGKIAKRKIDTEDKALVA